MEHSRKSFCRGDDRAEGRRGAVGMGTSEKDIPEGIRGERIRGRGRLVGLRSSRRAMVAGRGENEGGR